MFKKAKKQWESLSPEEQGEVFWIYMIRKCLQNEIIWKDPTIRKHLKEALKDDV